MSFDQIVAVIAIAAGVVVSGGGCLLGVALLTPALGRRVYRDDAPSGFKDPRRRQAAYIKEGALALYLLITGPVMIFFGLTQLQRAPFAVLETATFPLLMLGLTCLIVRRGMDRVLRQR